MSRIIQITDTHVVAPPALVAERVDTRLALESCAARIRAALDEIGPIDVIVATGDLTDRGGAAEFETFQRLIAPTGLPVVAIPGNHDRREPMRAAFAQERFMPESGPIDWMMDLSDFRLIALDTLIEGETGGELSARSLDFLRDALDGAGARPVLVALHHPPFKTGIRFMDEIGLKNAAAFSAALEGRSAETRVICGHVHRYITGMAGGCPAIIGPSTAHAIPADYRPDAPAGFVREPGGFLIHEWAGGFRSTYVGSEPAEGPFRFDDGVAIRRAP
ncbi:phosphodiesterase [Pikeienuella piscinae]|uniref:Phosphodiesterase n=1 Tax=Pikeienuella piscinae TaxID=2748098 RepID=A0A7L5BUN3_9RHOB|nr:phosphodiesterase [Pikeienuella piscinae]QIE55990.1 phosphodiesterase [Pikeienuella piscinae]